MEDFETPPGLHDHRTARLAPPGRRGYRPSSSAGGRGFAPMQCRRTRRTRPLTDRPLDHVHRTEHMECRCRGREVDSAVQVENKPFGPS